MVGVVGNEGVGRKIGVAGTSPSGNVVPGSGGNVAPESGEKVPPKSVGKFGMVGNCSRLRAASHRLMPSDARATTSARTKDAKKKPPMEAIDAACFDDESICKLTGLIGASYSRRNKCKVDDGWGECINGKCHGVETIELLDESCKGVGEEECLVRRTLAAHLDYIYTQKHNP
ncbi:hypothetical protein NL676_022779 [Syzygium grande]|nr:hypothetical protein NL676_022779 [Syzygium grande]